MRGVKFKIHPLFLIFCGICVLGGEARQTAAMLASLAIHEAGHLAASCIAGVRIYEIELMPFGAAIRLENLWRVRRAKLAFCALAGPAASLLAALLAVSAAWLCLGDADSLAAFADINARIALFNLLPALPMDGGRALFGLLNKPRQGALAGRAAALIIFILSFINGVNPLGIICAAYILAAASKETEASAGRELISLLDAPDRLRRDGHQTAHIVALALDASPAEALKAMRAGRTHLFLFFDDDMRLAGALDEAGLADWLSGGERRFLKCPEYET